MRRKSKTSSQNLRKKPHIMYFYTSHHRVNDECADVSWNPTNTPQNNKNAFIICYAIFKT